MNMTKKTAVVVDFEGCVPYDIEIFAEQLVQFNDSDYAFLSGGFVIIFNGVGSFTTSYDMGADADIKEVIEFTLKNNATSLLCRNADGVVVEYLINYLGKKIAYLGVVAQNAIKVAGGEILVHDGVNYVIAGEKLIPATNDGVIDIIPNGGGVIQIKADEASQNIKSAYGNYIVTLDNELKKDSVVIATGIVAITETMQDWIPPYIFGGDNILFEKYQQNAINVLGSSVNGGWIDAHNGYLGSAAYPCYNYGWSGVSQEGQKRTDGYCEGQLQNHTRRASASTLKCVVVATEGGEIKVLNTTDDTLSENILTDRGSQGWNDMFNITPDKAILFGLSGGATAGFPEAELSTNKNSMLCFTKL